MDAEKTGAYLAMLRKIKGMTQQEIADELGIARPVVAKSMKASLNKLKKFF